jgi:hypothetical protein
LERGKGPRDILAEAVDHHQNHLVGEGRRLGAGRYLEQVRGAVIDEPVPLILGEHPGSQAHGPERQKGDHNHQGRHRSI